MTPLQSVGARLGIRAALLLAAVLIGSLATTQGAGAQEDDSPPGPLATFELVEIGAVVDHISEADLADPGGAATATIDLAVQIETGLAERTDLRVVTSVYARVPDAASLDAALDGDLPSLFSSTSEELPDLEARSTRIAQLSLDATVLELAGQDRAGVYPLDVQLFSGADLLGTQTTSVIVLPEQAPAPLPTTLLLDLVAPTSPLVGEEPTSAFLDLLAPAGPVAVLGDAVRDLAARGTAAGITLVADGRTLEEFVGLADGWTATDGTVVDAEARTARRVALATEALADLARRGDAEVLAYPYGPADLVALVRGQLEDDARTAVAEAPVTVSDALGEPITDGIVVPPAGLDSATLAVVGQTDPSAMILREQDVTFADNDTTEPLRRLRTADGGEVRVLIPDRGLSSALSADPTPLGLQAFRARTALSWLSADDVRASSGVLLDLDALSLSGDDQSPAVDLAALHDVILDAPWLRPMAASTLAQTLRPSARLVRLAYGPAAAAAELPRAYIAAYGEARDALDPIGSMLPDGDRSPSGFAQLLEPMPSVRYRPPSRQTAGLLRGNQVITRLDALTRAVEIVPSAPITLTSTTGEVPVTVTNTSEVTLTVRVALESSRFEFDDGNARDITITPGASQRLSFVARSRNPGGFAPISVTLTDPAGTLTLATTQLSVRSTAIPVVGLIATIGSALFLIVWSVRRTRRRSPGVDQVRDHRGKAAA